MAPVVRPEKVPAQDPFAAVGDTTDAFASVGDVPDPFADVGDAAVSATQPIRMAPVVVSQVEGAPGESPVSTRLRGAYQGRVEPAAPTPAANAASERYRQRFGKAPAQVATEVDAQGNPTGAQVTTGQPKGVGVPRSEIDRLVGDPNLATKISARIALVHSPEGYRKEAAPPTFADLLSHVFLNQMASPIIGGVADAADESKMEEFARGGGQLSAEKPIGIPTPSGVPFIIDDWKASLLGAMASSGAVVGNYALQKALGAFQHGADQTGAAAASTRLGPAATIAAREAGAAAATGTRRLGPVAFDRATPEVAEAAQSGIPNIPAPPAMRAGAVKAIEDVAREKQVHPSLTAKIVQETRRAFGARAPQLGAAAVSGAQQGAVGAVIGTTSAVVQGERDPLEIAKAAGEGALQYGVLGAAFHALSSEAQFRLGYEAVKSSLDRAEQLRSGLVNRNTSADEADRTPVGYIPAPGEPRGAGPKSGSSGGGMKVEMADREQAVKNIAGEELANAPHPDQLVPRPVVKPVEGAGKPGQPRVLPPTGAVDEQQTRDIATRLAQGRLGAIDTAAQEMAARVPKGAVLVPLPDKSGTTATTKQLADAIASYAGEGSTVHDVLTEKKRLPKSATGPLFFVDNVETTGGRLHDARVALGRTDGESLAFAKAPIPEGQQAITREQSVETIARNVERAKNRYQKHGDIGALLVELADEQRRLEGEVEKSGETWVASKDTPIANGSSGSVPSGSTFGAGRAKQQSKFTRKRTEEIEQRLKDLGVHQDDIDAARSDPDLAIEVAAKLTPESGEADTSFDTAELEQDPFDFVGDVAPSSKPSTGGVSARAAAATADETARPVDARSDGVVGGGGAERPAERPAEAGGTPEPVAGNAAGEQSRAPAADAERGGAPQRLGKKPGKDSDQRSDEELATAFDDVEERIVALEDEQVQNTNAAKGRQLQRQLDEARAERDQIGNAIDSRHAAPTKSDKPARQRLGAVEAPKPEGGTDLFGKPIAPKIEQASLLPEGAGTELARSESKRLGKKDEKISAEEMTERRDELGAPSSSPSLGDNTAELDEGDPIAEAKRHVASAQGELDEWRAQKGGRKVEFRLENQLHDAQFHLQNLERDAANGPGKSMAAVELRQKITHLQHIVRTKRISQTDDIARRLGVTDKNRDISTKRLGVPNIILTDADVARVQEMLTTRERELVKVQKGEAIEHGEQPKSVIKSTLEEGSTPATAHEITMLVDAAKRLIKYEDTPTGAPLPRGSKEVREWAAKVLGRPYESRTWTMDDAYDAIEGAVNEIALERLGNVVDDVWTNLAEAKALEDKYFGNRARSEAAASRGQFSTPLPIARAAQIAAGVSSSDKVLEPTAGTGNLVNFLRGAGVRIDVNEIDPRRAAVLRALGFNPSSVDALRLPLNGKRYNVALLNPPYGSVGAGKYSGFGATPFNASDISQRFVYAALQQLVEGGRLVAIMPDNVIGAPGTDFRKWLLANHTPVAYVVSPKGAYTTRGTPTTETVMLVVTAGRRIGIDPVTLKPETWDDWYKVISRLADDTDLGRSTAGRQEAHDVAPVEQERSRLGPKKEAELFDRNEQSTVQSEGQTNDANAELNAGNDRGLAPRLGGKPGGPAGNQRLGRRPESGSDAQLGFERDTGVVAGPGSGNAGEAVAGSTPPVVPQVSGGTVESRERDLERARREVEAANDSPVFTPYALGNLERRAPHPRLVVETRAMAGMPAPPITAKLESKAVDAAWGRDGAKGGLSDEQAEGVLRGLSAWDNGHGFLFSDDVGVGKTREAAAMILEAIARGHDRIVFTTKNEVNLGDAVKEFRLVASGSEDGEFPATFVHVGDYKNVKKGTESLPMPKGPTVYLAHSYNFTDFAKALAEAKPTVWIADEAHEFKNQFSKRGIAWRGLTDQLLKADGKFAFFTATPAVTLDELGYLYGLKEWPIGGFSDWVDWKLGKRPKPTEKDAAAAQAAAEASSADVKAMGDRSEGGASEQLRGDDTMIVKGKKPFMRGSGDVFTSRVTPAETEQVMRELKGGGKYIARDLWRGGVKFEVHDIDMLGDTQEAQKARTVYDQAAELARDISMATRKFGRMNKEVKGAVGMERSLIQSYLKQLLFGIRLPTVLAKADEALGRGEQVVISLHSVTGDADADEGVSSADEEVPVNERLRVAISRINTEEVEKVDVGGGAVEYNNLGEIPEAIMAIAELKDRLKALPPLIDPIRTMEEHFGSKNTAVITGKRNAKQRKEAMGEFQRGTRKVAIISKAGKIGISLHDVNGKKRWMGIADYEWSADTFKQELGRVDRTGQKTNPSLTLFATNLAGEKKFAATIAARMSSLGATSKGSAESTGTDALDQFDVSDGISLGAMRETVFNMDDEQRAYFTGGKFLEWVRLGDGGEEMQPKKAPDSAGMKDFLLDLMMFPVEASQKVWEQWVQERDLLRTGDTVAAMLARRTGQATGEVLRTTKLTAAGDPPLSMVEMRLDSGEKRAILQGFVTPYMNEIQEARGPDSNGMKKSRRYVHVTAKDGTLVTGLELMPGESWMVKRLFGQGLRQTMTPDEAWDDLQAGDKISVKIAGPTLAKDRDALNGLAKYETVGNYLYVPDDQAALRKFLERFPAKLDEPTGDEAGHVSERSPAYGSERTVDESLRFAGRSQLPASRFGELATTVDRLRDLLTRKMVEGKERESVIAHLNSIMPEYLELLAKTAPMRNVSEAAQLVKPDHHQYSMDLSGAKPNPEEEQRVAFGSTAAAAKVAEEVNEIQRQLDPAARRLRLRQKDAAEKAQGWIDLRGRMLDTPDRVAAAIAPFRSPRMERFHVILMDANRRILSHTMETSGAINFVAFSAKSIPEIIARAKRVGATHAVIAHNHPSGNPTANSDDVDYTTAVGSALQKEGIRLDGHVVIDHDTFSWIRPGPHGTMANDVMEYRPPSTQAPEWTTANPIAIAVRNPNALARIILESGVHDDNGLTVLYLNAWHHAVAIEPVPARMATSVRAWLPQRIRAHAAKTAVIAGGPTTAGQVMGATANVDSKGKRLIFSSDHIVDFPELLDVIEFNGAKSTSYAGQGRILSLRDSGRKPGRRVFERPPLPEKPAEGESGGRDAAADEARGVPESQRVRLGPSRPLPDPSGLKHEQKGIRLSELLPTIKRLINPESLGEAARGAGGTLRHQNALSFREIVRVNEALREFSKKVDKLPRAKAVEYWTAAESGASTGDKEMDAGNALLHELTAKFTDKLIALDRLRAESAIENYIGRFWSRPTDKRGINFLQTLFSKRPFEGPKSFLKQRNLEQFTDGLDAGLTPATYNWVESQLAKITEMQRVIAAEQTLRAEKASGRAKPIMLGAQPPRDENGEPWVVIDRSGNDAAFTVYGPRQGMVKLPMDAKLAGIEPEDVTVMGHRPIGRWYAPKSAAAVWDAHLSRGFRGNALYDAYMAPAQAASQMLLSFSGFHFTVIATEGVFSDLALAIDNLANEGGTARLAPKQIGRAIAAPVQTARLGRRVMQQYRLPGAHPELERVLDAMMAGGFRGTAKSEFWSGERRDKLRRTFNEMMLSQSKGRRLWGAAKLPLNAMWAGMEWATGPLMEKYVPWMKTGATYMAVAQALAKLPADASMDDVHRVMGDVTKEMDYRFGQVVYDNHFINNAVKHIAQMAFLAPGWTFGTVALAARGLHDVTRAGQVVAGRLGAGSKKAEEPPPNQGEFFTPETKNVPPELVGKSAAYWIGAVLGTMMINGILTYLYTKEQPSGKDFFAFRDGTLDRDGNKNRHTIPGYLMKDIYGWSHHPVDTFKNKLSPVLTFMQRLAANKDYFGDKVYDPDASLATKTKQVASAAVEGVKPIALSSFQEGKQRGESGPGEAARNFFGIQPAKREFVRTDAQNKMAEYLRDQRPAGGRTPAEVEDARKRGDIRQRLREARASGDTAATREAKQDARQLQRVGDMTVKQNRQLVKGVRENPLVSEFKRLTFDQAVHVYKLANESERQLWFVPFRKKAANSGRMKEFRALNVKRPQRLIPPDPSADQPVGVPMQRVP